MKWKTVALGAALSVLAACGNSGPADSPDLAGAGSVPSGGSGASPKDERDCLWVLNSSVNTLFPDTSATYWLAALAIPPGGAIRFDGEYPHARYISFNLYNELLQPIDGANDTAIQPAAGSSNPYIAGADRAVIARSYSEQLIAAVPPADPAQRLPNTLYSAQTVGTTQVATNLAIVLYRVYVADKGLDTTGGTGLPRIRFVLADGSVQSGPAVCSALDTLSFAIPNLSAVPAALNSLPVSTAASQYPLWLKFFDLQSSEVARAYATPLGPALYELAGSPTSGSGGFLSNIDNRYISASISQQLGKVVALRPQMPQTPMTYDGESPMQDGTMRYWSLCSNNADTTAVIACLYDEQVVRDNRNRAVIAVSRAADRPANARPECGVSWLDWGEPDTGLLILRNQLVKPQSVFPQAIQYVPGPPGTHEAEVMPDYYPYGSHLSKAGFEALGCPVSADAIPTVVTPPP